MTKSYLYAGILTLIATGWIVSGFFISSAPKEEPASSLSPLSAEKEAFKVEIKKEKARSTDDIVTLLGQTEADKKVTLKAEIAGTVEHLFVQKGMLLKEGTKIAKISEEDLPARLAKAKALLQQRALEVNAAEKLAAKGFNSDIQLSEATAHYKEAKADLEKILLDRAHTTISAPMTGILLENQVEEGDFVSIGSNLVTLLDLDPLIVSGHVSEQNFYKLKEGLTTTVLLSNGDHLQGKISYLSAQANDQTRTFKVEIAIPNPEQKYAEGLTARLEIPTAQKSGFFISPALLTLNDQGIVGVKTVDRNNIVHFLPVTILNAQTNGLWIQGTTPLSELTIISVGQEYVTDGQKVQPIEASSQGKDDILQNNLSSRHEGN